MKSIIFLILILLPLSSGSQTINDKDLDSAIMTADKLIMSDPRIFFKNVQSFIVYHSGNIRFEKYYNGFIKGSLHTTQSQTKSIIAILMGIAIDKGFVPGENEPVKNYFPDYFKPGDHLKSEIKISDILTMSPGFTWQEFLPVNDPRNDNINMFNSNHYLNYILSKEVSDSLTGKFNYNSGCPMIIAGIIEKATKMSLEKFAENYLFKPLKISEYNWIKDSTGFCHAGGGLDLKPADIIKIGILVLNIGKWENQQVVSGDWITKMMQPYQQTNINNSDYGYFWWVRNIKTGSGNTTAIVSAEGAGGQKLYIFPDYDLIVAFTERNYNTPQVSPLFINESIVPLLR